MKRESSLALGLGLESRATSDHSRTPQQTTDDKASLRSLSRARNLYVKNPARSDISAILAPRNECRYITGIKNQPPPPRRRVRYSPPS
ncbi:hypothetical protein EVAR_30670_1 [Eumeta japonica]|uniref:Uncharacterized protein n=1 Tax=Eumeta variegata TaxID=151549 RepID=A0A4C1VS96_EUMVA|nr:hypothetical protein EVAR_30670_1 [Eumeta japonica]